HAYPGLVDREDSVALRLFESQARAAQAHRSGLARLLLLVLPEQVKLLEKRFAGMRDMCLRYSTIPAKTAPSIESAQPTPCDELKRHLLIAVAEQVCAVADQPVRTARGFGTLRDSARSRLVPTLEELRGLVDRILLDHHTIQQQLAQLRTPHL